MVESNSIWLCCRTGLYNGGILPPVFYVPGTNSSAAANRSLTLTNVTIAYDTCIYESWHNMSRAIAGQLQVRSAQGSETDFDWPGLLGA